MGQHPGINLNCSSIYSDEVGQHAGMTPTSEIRMKLFSGKQVGQYPGIKLKQATKCSDSFVPKVGGSTSPEWWVNINRNGGSTWFGIYNYEQTLDIIKKYVTECSRTLHKLKTEDLKPENIELKNCLQIIDEIILRIYFQFGSRPLGQANIKLPIDEENRKAFYFMIKPIFRDIIQLSSEIGTGLITGHTAHYFIQSLNIVLQYDQKDILSMVTSITKYARQTGYTFDSHAIQDAVSITEKILADNRSLLLEDESFNNLIDLLDIYINSGWVEALDLLWKLDEVFK